MHADTVAADRFGYGSLVRVKHMYGGIAWVKDQIEKASTNSPTRQIV
jgi:hypothetical protein